MLPRVGGVNTGSRRLALALLAGAVPVIAGIVALVLFVTPTALSLAPSGTAPTPSGSAWPPSGKGIPDDDRTVDGGLPGRDPDPPRPAPPPPPPNQPGLVSPGAPPFLAVQSLPPGVTARAYWYLLSASVGGSAAPVTNWVITGLPAGISYDPLGYSGSSTRLTGFPATAGYYVVTVQASNRYGTTVRQLPFTVSQAPPRITTTSFLDATAGSFVNRRIDVDFAGAKPAETSMTAVGLPPGLQLGQTAGVWSIFGVPTLPGTYAIQITVTTKGGTATATIALTVRPPLATEPPPPAPTPTPTPTPAP